MAAEEFAAEEAGMRRSLPILKGASNHIQPQGLEMASANVLEGIADVLAIQIEIIFSLILAFIISLSP